jgi:hypothetical protein
MLVMMKMKCCEYGPWDPIDSTSYSLLLMNGKNKSGCCIRLGRKGLQWKTLQLIGLIRTYEEN